MTQHCALQNISRSSSMLQIGSMQKLQTFKIVVSQILSCPTLVDLQVSIAADFRWTFITMHANMHCFSAAWPSTACVAIAHVREGVRCALCACMKTCRWGMGTTISHLSMQGTACRFNGVCCGCAAASCEV